MDQIGKGATVIFARLEQAGRYLALHSDFPAAIAFLREPTARRSAARTGGDSAATVYATISRSPARRRSEARLEAHRRHIDIQCVINGVEEMGWTPRAPAVNSRTASTMPRKISTCLTISPTASSPCARGSPSSSSRTTRMPRSSARARSTKSSLSADLNSGGTLPAAALIWQPVAVRPTPVGRDTQKGSRIQ